MTKPTLLQLFADHPGQAMQKWSAHMAAFERLFTPYREVPLRLLEISATPDGTIELWARYFSQASVLLSCVAAPAMGDAAADGRVRRVVGAPEAPAVMAEVLRHSVQFDIIIDNASLTGAAVASTFSAYFPLLADGGLYLVENLDSSYQQRHGGGLYAPYASLAFFKRLVDVIGHEHWGVARSRASLLTGFFAPGAAALGDADLAQLESVEFINALCVVRKRADGGGIGSLLSVGPASAYAAGRQPPYAAPFRFDPAQQQSANPWSTLAQGPDESWQAVTGTLQELQGSVEQLRRELALRDADIAALYGSTSWRVSKPLRLVSAASQRVRRVSARVPLAIRRSGGVQATALKALQVYRRDGMGGLRRGLNNVVAPVAPAELARNDYADWLSRYATLDDAAQARLQRRIDAMPFRPTFSVIMPVFNSPLAFLEQAINSVRQQLYPDWELCIADDASSDPAVRQLLERHRAEEPRIKLVYRAENGHISASSNSALALASGDFVALFDHDDLLDAQALFWMAEAINGQPDAGLLYSDEDKVDEHNRRYDPYFKSDLNYELLLAQNMVCHLGVYRTALVRQLGGFQLGYEGAQDYDLALRVIEQLAPQQVVHVPRVLYHWRAIAGSTALGAGEKNYAARAGRKAVAAHLARVGLPAEVLAAPSAPGVNRVRFACPTPQPLVSILIPTRDRADLLGMCLDTLLERSTYSNYEVIIVDNGSVEEKTQQLFARLPKDRVRILRDDSAFNFSALNNHAARVARGQYLCLMNNDIEILTPDWLEEMVSFAARPDIGCVGARLWYPDGRLQHGGVVLGIGGIAGHAHKYLPRGQNGYFGRALLHQSYSAVTAACLLLRREVFEQVGGLDEALVIAFNDVDFCLRVREAGYRNVWTPYAEMIHHESASRGEEDSPEKIARFGREIAFVEARWGEQLRTDPAYNPNLTLVHEDYSLAWPPRVASL
jgi:GT2 family glycosyltransferase